MYTVLLDTENLGTTQILKIEDQARESNLRISQRWAFERNNQPIAKNRRELLEELGYKML